MAFPQVLTLSKCTCIIDHMEHEAWIKSLRPELTPTTAAKAAGLSYSTVLRQIDRGHLSADNVIAIARAYNAGIVDSLIATDHISPDEVDIIGVVQALGYATNQELLGEMNKRVDPEATRLFHGGDGSIAPHFPSKTDDSPSDGQGESDVESLGTPGSDHAAVVGLDSADTSTPERSNLSVSSAEDEEDDGTVRDWDESIPHAADHTIDEGKAREARGEDPID